LVNQLIPTDFTVFPQETVCNKALDSSKYHPQCTDITPSCQLYHLQTPEYELPDISIWIKINSNDRNCYHDAGASMLRKMWTSLFAVFFREQSYCIQSANSSVILSNTHKGITFNLRGYE
jgi:secreted Zn-dependent insulinase-like peptidase